MTNYYKKNGYEGMMRMKDILGWLEREKGFTFLDCKDYGETPCREIRLYGDKVGEVWCNYAIDLDHDTLQYIEENDIMAMCDAVQ